MTYTADRPTGMRSYLDAVNRARSRSYANATRYRVFGYRTRGGPWRYVTCRWSVWSEEVRVRAAEGDW